MNAVTKDEVMKDGIISNQSKEKELKVISPFKSTLVWVNPANVLANPLSIRDGSEDLGDITEILETLDWCQPLSAYQDGENWILLSGQNRRDAAYGLGMKEIPIYAVEKPANELEEMKRYRGLQEAQHNWNSYDSAKRAFELYNIHQCKKIVAKEMDVSEGKIGIWLSVVNFFSKNERKIAKNLMEKRYTINMLHNVVLFVNKLEKHFPNIVDELSIDYIRGSLLSKASKKQINSNLNSQNTLNFASKSQVKAFLTTNMSLKDFRKAALRNREEIVTDYEVNNMVISTVTTQMEKMDLGTKSEMKKLKEYIQEILSVVKETKNKL